MTGQLWSGTVNPRDHTGNVGRAKLAEKRAREEAETIAALKLEGRPDADQTYTSVQFDMMAASGEYRDGELMGFTAQGQPVEFYHGEAVITDARTSAPKYV
jgi:hypothetical protein